MLRISSSVGGNHDPGDVEFIVVVVVTRYDHRPGVSWLNNCR
jgi:hypothetical protein